MAYRYYRRSDMAPIWVIMGINLILFIVTSVAPAVLVYLGLIPAIIADRPWSIITSIFLHGGIWHILANMITLFFFGRYLCVLLGERKFFTVYFVGGILGNLLYLLIPAFPISNWGHRQALMVK